ncbi:hypothetical protein QVD17_09508 [Tagetes erecta]|uniref:Retrotransposon gag domain-containing protein n=1 Tax=Tagetes erecta TaxID=13708 RepID=A0AAD8L7H1_TARER|nr:hypothetical protein QVD17_09508 [Tagetes erecta]
MAEDNDPPGFRSSPTFHVSASSHTSSEMAGQNTPTTDGPQVELSLQEFHTPSPSRMGLSSPRDDLFFPVEKVDLTPEGVRRHFLQLRELMNGYVSEERAKGVRVRLAYGDESEITLAPLPPPFDSTTSPSTSRWTPRETCSRPVERANQETSPAITPRNLELTMDQVFHQPSISPPTTTSFEEALRSLPLLQSVVSPIPVPANCSSPSPFTPQGFAYPNYMHPQMAAFMMAQTAQQWGGAYPWLFPPTSSPLTAPQASNIPITGQPTPNPPVTTQQVSPPVVTHEAGTSRQMTPSEPSKPYRSSSLSCFSEEIANFEFQAKIKMPSNVKTYDGTEDPEDHLQVFTGAASVERWTNAECCHMFMQTLVGSARLWFSSLPAGSIHSFDDLHRSFLMNFTQQRRYTKDAAVLYQIQQRDNEDLRSFMERYKKDGLSYNGATEKMRVSGFMNAIRPKKLLRNLHENIPQTMKETFERAEAYLRGEEALDNRETRKRDRQPWRGNSSPNKKPHFQPFVERRSHRHYDHKRRDDRRDSPRSSKGQDKEKHVFTVLTKTPLEVFTTEEARYSFRPPRPLTKPVSKRDSGKFCVFHNDVGHHTNDCFQLKKRIEEAVKSGDLAHLVKEFKDKKESKKGAECNMVHTAAKPFGRSRSGAWTRLSIDFPPTDPEIFIITPVIIEAELDGSLIDRVYMDCGAGAEIMYERCILQLSEETRAKLQPSETPLVGFAGERVHPLGQITLEVCLRDGDLSRVEELTFAVVRHPSHYNIIIGRSGISAFQAIVSTSHGMMKFLTEGGVATLKPTAEALLIASAEEASDAEQKQVIEVSLNCHTPTDGGNLRADDSG